MGLPLEEAVEARPFQQALLVSPFFPSSQEKDKGIEVTRQFFEARIPTFLPPFYPGNRLPSDRSL